MRVGIKNLAAVILLTLLYSGLLLLIQRAEKRRRLWVTIILVPVGIVTHFSAAGRGTDSESILAFVLALVLNILFWLIIGRYNPVGSSDDIKVIGLDD
jgi:hypothetical protein